MHIFLFTLKTILIKYIKMPMLTINFYDKDLSMDEQRPKEVRIKYFEPLTMAVEKFNEIYACNRLKDPAPEISKVYNQYGQDLPLTYRIQKTNLDLFY